MTVNAEEKVEKTSETVILQLSYPQSGTGYFYILWKSTGPGEFKPIYKSEGSSYQNGKQNWREAVLDTNLLCNTDENLELRIDVMLAQNNGDHKMMMT